jgi:hypothetical protein
VVKTFRSSTGYRRRLFYKGIIIKGPRRTCFNCRKIITAEWIQWIDGREFCLKCSEQKDRMLHGERKDRHDA